MISAYAISDVRAAEAEAMAHLAEGELMARAADGLAMVVAARTPHGGRIAVLVGSGGNGGDALYAAEELATSAAHAILTVVLVADEAHAGGLKAAKASGVRVLDANDDAQLERAVAALAEADVVIDGIAGIGGRPGFRTGVYEHHLKALLEAIPDSAYVVAVDLPSGSDPSGEIPGTLSVWADETVTFGVAKPVHLLTTAPACGRLTIVDIGLRIDAAPSAQSLDHDDVAKLWPVPTSSDDKYSRGVLGVVAGGENYTGAAVLVTTAAVCAGAGMVRYVGPPGPSGLIRAQVPEVVHGGGTSAQVQAWVVGPGLDAEGDAEQRAAGLAALASEVPCLVDAGGLDLLDGPRARAGARTLLTPHAGELARLLTRLDPDGHDGLLTADQVRAYPVYFARRAAELLHATVLLKGSITLVVPPPASGLPVRAQADAPAWAGTAGSGDVLAGIAGTLLAAGLDPLDAGSLAALIHGVATRTANPGGPVRALGVAHAIPETVAALLRRR